MFLECFTNQILEKHMQKAHTCKGCSFLYHFQNCLDLTGSSFTYLTNVIFGKQKQGFYNNGSCSMFRLLPHQLFILVQEECLQALKASKLQPCKVFEHYSLHRHPNPTVKHCVMVCMCQKLKPEVLHFRSG